MQEPLTKTITLKPLYHRGQDCIRFDFTYDQELDRLVRSIPGRKFSITHSCWYLVRDDDAISKILAVFKDKAWVDLKAVTGKKTPSVQADPPEPPVIPASPVVVSQRPASHTDALEAMQKKLTMRNYSINTKRTYLNQFQDFLRFYYDSDPGDLNELDIHRYMLYLIEKRKLSVSTQNTAINAIKFFYEKILKQERKVYDLDRPMREIKLPRVLSQQEIFKIFGSINNLKHKLMMMVIYSGGLRRSELLNLRKGDLDIDRGVIFIRGGKGRKDRQTLLAENIVPYFEAYLKEYKPLYWLFEGEDGGKYSASSLQKILKVAVARAGIDRRITLHMLRHSFATHLLEGGTSTRYIQFLLGHESPKTTEMYTHVTRFAIDKIKSPLDNLDLENKKLGPPE
jgi:site-specific recombinase XerD